MAGRAAFVYREDGEPVLNAYARRIHARALADAFYLSVWRSMGPQAAGRATCARFGHDVRAGRCDRCGLGVAAVREERLLGR